MSHPFHHSCSSQINIFPKCFFHQVSDQYEWNTYGYRRDTGGYKVVKKALKKVVQRFWVPPSSLPSADGQCILKCFAYSIVFGRINHILSYRYLASISLASTIRCEKLWEFSNFWRTIDIDAGWLFWFKQQGLCVDLIGQA